MSEAPPSTSAATAASLPAWWRRAGLPHRRLLAGLALALAPVAVVLAVTNPLGGGPSGRATEKVNTTSLVTVTRRSLSSQTLVNGTLGYAGSSDIALPSGSAPADVEKAREAVASGDATLRTAQATLAADKLALAQARGRLAADTRKRAVDCAGDNAAGGGGSGPTPCVTAAQAVARDGEAVTTAAQRVTADARQVSDRHDAVAAAKQGLDAVASSALFYGPRATYTTLPAPGRVVRRGQPLYAIDRHPVLLLYGPVTPWRALRPGMSRGRDVAELNANLRALRYGRRGLGGDTFSAATAAAVRAMQAAHGLARSGGLALGSVVFRPGAVRVTHVTATVDATVRPGPLLTVSSTRHQVAIKLDAARQSDVKVGAKVAITLPDNRKTPGVVASVGRVASAGSGGESATIPVQVRLAREAAAGDLVQAPVNVSITTASVKDALVVPVNALLALAGGGYAVETSDAAGVRHLVPVEIGLFDDEDGLVQVIGSGLHAGQRVVVPRS